jgi:hypothetical protein
MEKTSIYEYTSAYCDVCEHEEQDYMSCDDCGETLEIAYCDNGVHYCEDCKKNYEEKKE